VRPFKGKNVFPYFGCLVSGRICARADVPNLGLPLVSPIASPGLEFDFRLNPKEPPLPIGKFSKTAEGGLPWPGQKK
jgi:hypothetical protein